MIRPAPMNMKARVSPPVLGSDVDAMVSGVSLVS
jgi:hypothetical protein